MKRVYVVTTYVSASSVSQAIKLAKKLKPHDVCLEPSSRQSMIELLAPTPDKVGFNNLKIKKVVID